MSSKRKSAAKLAAPVLKQSAKYPLKANVDESKASVSAAAPRLTANAPSLNAIEISSDSESNYDDVSLDEDAGNSEEEDSQDTDDAKIEADTNGKGLEKSLHGIIGADTEMLSPPVTREGDEVDPDGSDLEPTFGDLIRNNETIDVNAELAPRQLETPSSLVQSHTRVLAPPSLSSLGTVLNQALRTDDTDLLESCLRTPDVKIVQNTIQRMDSTLAGTLLTKLAARLHRRPGRAHSLMSWIQWTLVAHGGALSSQPDLASRLEGLDRVLDERARGLNSLLTLKGKLDMLEAQMQLRRGNRTGRSGENASDDESGDGEPGIIYIEGEEDEAADLQNGVTGKRTMDEDDEDGLILADGAEDSDESSEDDSEDDVDVDRPALADDDVLYADEVDHDDVDESEDGEDSEVDTPAPPAKLQKTAKTFSKKR